MRRSIVTPALVIAGAFVMTNLGCKARSSDSNVKDDGSGSSKITIDGLKSWASGSDVTDWDTERSVRESVLKQYLYYDGSDSNSKYGFRSGQSPKLAWKWFEESPVGFGGVPFVVLKAILNLDSSFCTDQAKVEKYNLCEIYKIWHRDSKNDGAKGTLDHIGVLPHPEDYEAGRLKSPSDRRWPLPYGLTIQGGKPGYDYNKSPFEEDVDVLDDSTYKTVRAEKYKLEQGVFQKGYKKAALQKNPPANPPQTEAEWEALFKSMPDIDPSVFPAEMRAQIKYAALGAGITSISTKLAGLKAGLDAGKLHIAEVAKGFLEDDPQFNLDGRPWHEQPYNDNYETFGRPTGFDRVFFSCAACHVGRVKVKDKVMYVPGAPNNEIEAQYYSKLLMETGIALSTGFNRNSPDLIVPRGQIKPNPKSSLGLAQLLLETASTDEGLASLYGSSTQQKLRGRLMVFRTISNITMILKDLIGSAVKVHFIYYGQRAYKPRSGEKMPDVMEDRIGQMDAFGIASGLSAIHAIRTDNSFLKFLYRDQYDIFQSGKKHEVFGGFAYFDKNTALGRGVDMSKPEEEQINSMKKIIFENRDEWTPPVPGGIDTRSLFMLRDNYYANWDGNQGASARTLASGTSATGDPRQVNVEIHEPLNPFINHLPPKPYPFAVDIAKASEGRDIFNEHCSNCHSPKNKFVYSLPGIDLNRTKVNTSVSRTMLAGLVLEACAIYRNNNEKKPGSDFCMPEGTTSEERLKNYFEDTPGRVENLDKVDSERAGGLKAGYKADVLYGIWSRAPYLHNGSVPTLGHLLCSKARPKKFKRGNIDFDDKMVGFEWVDSGERPAGEGDTYLVKTYDTSYMSRSNGGHVVSESTLCPDLDGLDPVNDREKIASKIGASKAGSLIEYLKTM